jgi:arsenate reductase-like glutaredoxin family protein
MKKKEPSHKFKCQKCEKTKETADSKDIVPECCDILMQRMEEPDPCQLSATAEHARPNEILEPCNDGRKGRI